jgi:hypothetical protein
MEGQQTTHGRARRPQQWRENERSGDADVRVFTKSISFCICDSVNRVNAVVLGSKQAGKEAEGEAEIEAKDNAAEEDGPVDAEQATE